MKNSILTYYSIIFVMSIICLFSSCDNDKDDLQSLCGTVWIHKYTQNDNIIDGAAAALYFGKNKVEYYALDGNLKVLRLIKSLDYQVKERTIVIGFKEGSLNDNSLYFNSLIYYRSSKSKTDLLTQ